jgi:glycosyltransferase involved in cell wall biosynthesis
MSLVFIFAYHFPPDDAIGGERPYRFWKYLRRMGHDCHVFTAALQKEQHAAAVVSVSDPWLDQDHGLGWHLERVLRKLVLPGESGIRWSYHASRAARDFLLEYSQPRVIIFSTSPPVGTHFAAWRLSRAENIPWIADLRDPLVGDWKFEHSRFWQRKAYTRLEHLIVNTADAVIFNTDTSLASCMERFPQFSKKFHVIWNGFDPEEQREVLTVPTREHKILSHIGDLYQGRSATVLLESISRLMASGRLCGENVRVRLMGSAEPGSIAIDDKTQRPPWLDVVNRRVSKSEAHQAMKTSDYLLLLQPQSAVQVPGKLFEYIRIGRPILAVIPSTSPVERLLKESGVRHQCIYPNWRPDAIDDAVERFFHLDSTPIDPSPRFENMFNAISQTRQLDAIMSSLCPG